MLLFNIIALSQERGIPFHRNYTVKDYNGATQNWAIVQDHRGIIYVGNDDGVLQYDGTNWRKIKIANLSGIRSLGVDSSGVVYVGAYGEFGYLKPDYKGSLQYYDLKHLLDSVDRDFIDVWCSLATSNGTYFLVEQSIFHYQKGKITIIKPSGDYFFLAFNINDKIYLSEMGVGLEIIENDSIRMLPGGEVFKNYGIFSFVLHKKDTFFLGRPEFGIITYDLNAPRDSNNPSLNYKLMKTDGSEYLKEFQVYAGVNVGFNRFAYATTRKGIAIIDENGNIKETFHYENVLMDEAVYNLSYKENNPLFAALDNGLARIEINSPFRYWDKTTGFRGTVLDIIRFNGKIHIATVHGVYVLSKNPSLEKGVNTFSKIKGLLSQSWKLLEFKYKNEKFLLVGSDDGIYKIENDTAIKISDYSGGFTLFQSKKKPNKVYAGTRDCLNSFEYKNGKFIEYVYENIELQKEIRSINEDSLGNLWVSANFDGIIRINWDDEKPIITKYDTSNGLPSLKEIDIYNINNKLKFGTKEGLYIYNEKSDSFVPDLIFGKAFAAAKLPVNSLLKDKNGNYFISGKHRLIKTIDNNYNWDSISFKRLPMKYMESSYIDTNNMYWVGGSEGLFRFNPVVKKDYTYVNSLKTLIRKVSTGEDSVLFNGYFFDKTSTENPDVINPLLDYQTEDFIPKIDFNIGSIVFYYSLPFYESESSNQYSFFLKGFDKNWSEWTSETKKEYTNLSEGEYTFIIKGINIYGMESLPSSYQFVILPPWYRSWIAFLSYLVLLVVFISLIIRLRTTRLEKDKQKLEDIVLERTAEIHSQKEEIESQAEWLQYANQNMLEQKHEILFQSERLMKTNEELEKKSNELILTNIELEKLSLVASKTDNAVSIMDSRGNFEWLNDGFERMYGYNLSQLIKEKKRNIIGTHAGISSKDIANLWYGDKKTMIYESENETRMGHKIWTQTTLTPILDKKKNVKKLVAIETDITVLKKAEAQIQKQHDELAKANATKDTFFSIIAHDLRSPFSSFVSLTNLMVENIEDFSSEEIEKYLKEIRNTSQITFSLIENLLDWARSQKGEISFIPKKLDAAALINENIELLNENAQQKNIQLISKVSAKTTIFADENMIHTVFRNLISNAIKFTEEKGKIIVSAKKTDKFVEFAVKDNGVGIAKKNIDDIFRIDKRHTTLGTKREKGTGLGLILCKEFIDKNKGEIRIESKKDEGTIFFFTIPATKL